MTNDQQWQPPSGAPRDAGEPVQPISPPVPPVSPVVPPDAGYYALPGTPPPFGASGAGSTGAGRPGQSAWTPPPKPGLIPLQPLDLGTILGASFRVLRRNPRPTFGAALLIQGLAYLLLVGVVGYASYSALARIGASTQENTNSIVAGSYGLIGLAAIVPGLLAVIASALLQGIIVLEVASGTLGEKLRLSELWRRARGRIGALVGWSALLILFVTVVFGVLVLLIVVVITTLGVAGIVIGVMLGLFGGLVLAALFIWLGTKLALVPSALMIERLSIRESVARSWSLTRGAFWKTFGIIALVSVIIGVVSQVISAPLSFLGPMATTLLDPNRQNGQNIVVVTIVITVLALVISVVFQAITSVVQSATTALIYIDLRIRKEGLDLELARFVEARQAGDSSVPDPYLSHRLPPFPAPKQPSGAPRDSASVPPANGSPWG